MEDIYTKLIDMPTSIRGYTIHDKNGDFCIVINARISQEDMVETYIHEIKHIKRGDVYKKGSVDLIEIYAHM